MTLVEAKELELSSKGDLERSSVGGATIGVCIEILGDGFLQSTSQFEELFNGSETSLPRNLPPRRDPLHAFLYEATPQR
jgi:hypothetical protein